MTKRFFGVLFTLVLLWQVSVLPQDARDISPTRGNDVKLENRTEAIWDVLFNYDAGLLANNTLGNAGIVYIPTLNVFWMSKWASQKTYVISPTGTLVDSFALTGVGSATSYVRSMTFDGQYVYMGANSATIFKVDPATRTVAGTITVPTAGGTVRYLAYDPNINSGAGGFWFGNFTTPVRKVSMTGTLMPDSLPYASLGSTSNYGLAYDNASAGGPYLWIWGQGAGAGTAQVIVQISVATGLPTGVTHDVMSDVGAGNAQAIAGGLNVSKDVRTGKVTLIGLLQGTPDRLFGYEIGTTVIRGPGLPTNPAPANNATGVVITSHPYVTWANPDSATWNVVYFSTNQTAVNNMDAAAKVLDGAPSTKHTSYNNAANLQYATSYYWRVVERRAGDTTVGPVWKFTTQPAPAPNPATSVAATYSAADTSVTVTWVNPTTNVNGGPITVDSSVIWMDTSRVGKVAGTGVSFKHRYPPAGFHIYKVVSFAAGYGSVPSPAPVVGVGIYIYNFKRNNLNLAIPDNDIVTGVSDVVQVLGLTEATIGKVTVTIDTIIHTWDADIDAQLIGPDGVTMVDLTSDNGSSGDNYIGCKLDDEATASVTTATAPMTGSWKPEAPLSVFNGRNSAGAWTLKLFDDAAQDLGTLQAWTLTIITAAPIIPVELTSFRATSVGNDVTLSWTTGTETNNKGFEVQRKTESGFVTVGYVAGHGTTTELQRYSFTEKGLRAGKVSYRLKQVDYDGKENYSYEANTDVVAPVEFSLDQNYPNPFNPSTSITFSLPVDAKVSLRLYNALGQEIRTLVSGSYAAGNHNYQLNAAALSSGVYYYRIDAAGVDGKNYSSIKKMMLMK